MFIRIRRFLPETKVEGPGNRACIWVQGCSIQCSDCAVPESWPTSGGEKVKVEELAQKILNIPNIEGITFSGGEPFDQAKSLASLGCIVQKEGLSVVTFTGYTLENIQNSADPGWQDLLSVTDLLIDGPYISEGHDPTNLWVGSYNQRYHFLTSRYIHLKYEISDVSNRIEVRIQEDGSILVNGMTNFSKLEDIFKGII
ncbi:MULTISPECIES: 4Fe-4S single cluster domain-containing protein [Methanobacterium]|uniref:4Fe-4S single cluster domain-containing protein n=1 Tax=Methanobacterium veterum TaxID=408577 RepID=A0A9E4ZZN8_9EURY|nr:MULTISPECIES: 4Fe-4S single cluster domain-containing protein [Methanobacterium]MCZ3366918.1 4Fe-4S single cluster domain-containing protein [Methanobacterium veterum]MCZ3373935.1 4Fe-4S single cluster domain-containing protein [Methanobacterium veterum]